MYKEYTMECFKEKMSREIKDIPLEKSIATQLLTKKHIPDIFAGLPLVSDLEGTEVYDFCVSRKLPIESFDFRFAEEFIKWTKGNTDKFEKVIPKPDHSRLILPWRDRDNKIIGYSARALDNKQEQKYIRIFVDDETKEHFFGLDKLDDTKTHYVLEGEIDSLMIPNAIAVSNGKLHTYLHDNAVYIPDSDTRNPQIMKNVGSMIDLGLSVCLLPDLGRGKDLNELVQSGLTSDEVLDIINKNTVQGLSGKLKFNQWKKV